MRVKIRERSISSRYTLLGKGERDRISMEEIFRILKEELEDAVSRSDRSGISRDKRSVVAFPFVRIAGNDPGELIKRDNGKINNNVLIIIILVLTVPVIKKEWKKKNARSVILSTADNNLFSRTRLVRNCRVIQFFQKTRKNALNISYLLSCTYILRITVRNEEEWIERFLFFFFFFFFFFFPILASRRRKTASRQRERPEVRLNPEAKRFFFFRRAKNRHLFNRTCPLASSIR